MLPSQICAAARAKSFFIQTYRIRNMSQVGVVYLLCIRRLKALEEKEQNKGKSDRRN